MGIEGRKNKAGELYMLLQADRWRNRQLGLQKIVEFTLDIVTVERLCIILSLLVDIIRGRASFSQKLNLLDSGT